MTFRVGQKVVLVGWKEKNVRLWKSIGARYPDVGDVYTVRAINPWADGDSFVLLLEEIDNSHLPYRPEPGFNIEYFRPAVNPRASFNALKAPLVPGAKIKEEA